MYACTLTHKHAYLSACNACICLTCWLIATFAGAMPDHIKSFRPTMYIVKKNVWKSDKIWKFKFKIQKLKWLKLIPVYSRKLQCFFGTSSSSLPSPVSLEVIELVPSWKSSYRTDVGTCKMNIGQFDKWMCVQTVHVEKVCRIVWIDV